MQAFSVFLVIVFMLMYWNFSPAATAVLATIRSQDGGSKKTYFLGPIHPSVPKTADVMSNVGGLNGVSKISQTNSSVLLPSMQSVDSLLLHHQFQQKNRQAKPLFMDINVILGDASPLVPSTQVPSTTTVLNDHYATTTRSIDEKHLISDPFRPELDHQSTEKTNNYGLSKDSKSIWLLDDEDYEDTEESDDYEVVDLSQPTPVHFTDLPMTSNDELDPKEYPSHFKEEYEDNPDEDTILVIGQLSTLNPVIPASERVEGPTESTSQFHKEENSPAQIGLSEWPVQVGLQARSKSSFAIKLEESLNYNLNKQQMTPGTQDSGDQQLENPQTKFNENHQSNGIALHAKTSLNSNGSTDIGNSNHFFFRPPIRSQFMHSPVAKTVPRETSKKLAEIEMTNHYGNPNGGKPIKGVSSTTTLEPGKPKHYISPQEERTQDPSTTTEVDEPLHYLNSEEETDHNISLDYPEEEDLFKPIASGINTSGTVTRPEQLPVSLGRPPYFVSSSLPVQQPVHLGNNFELMNPVGLAENRMNIDPNKGITFVDDVIQPIVVVPFPADHGLISQPNLVVKPQPLMSTVIHPIGEIDISKQDSFLINYNDSKPFAHHPSTGPSIATSVTAKPPYISSKVESKEMDLKDLIHVKPPLSHSVQEKMKKSDEIKQHQIKIDNIKAHEDPILPIIHHDELPLLKTTSSYTQVQPINVNQPTKPMTSSKSDSGEIIVTPHRSRPSLQTPYGTRPTNKAGSGPYFVSSVVSSFPSNSFSAQGTVTKPLIENNRSLAAKKDEGIINGSTSSATLGRPPYFVTNPLPTPLQPINLNAFTTKPPRNTKTDGENSDGNRLSPIRHILLYPSSSENHTFTKEQTTIMPVPMERTTGLQTNNFDISFGPVRPTLPYILTRLNAAKPIQPFYPSSIASNVTERIINIDLPVQEGTKLTIGSLPSPIGISNKNNVFVVPKQIGNETARTSADSSIAPTVLSTSKPRSSNRKNQTDATMRTIVNHNMGSFVVTTSPIRSPIRSTYTSRPVIVAPISKIKESDFVKPTESEEKHHQVDTDYPAQEKIDKTTAVAQNPIGISNKNNVFVVPKTAKGIIRPMIRINTLPADPLVKEQIPHVKGEQQSSTLRPFERVVSHQMGSFIVTSSPQSVHRIPNTVVKETNMPVEISEIVIRSPTESASLAQPPYFETSSMYELVGSNKRKMGKSEQIVRSRTGIGSINANMSPVGFMAQASLIDRPPPAEKLTNKAQVNMRKPQQSRTPHQQRPNRRIGNRWVATVTHQTIDAQLGTRT